MSDVGYYCGVDIGGTFTDCVLLDSEGAVAQSKASTTPDDFSLGLLAAVEQAADTLGRSASEVLASTDLLLHGTTIGTNILVQNRGAKTGLITTRGHASALLMMRSAGRSAGLPIEQLLHVSRHRKPEPIVPASRIKEVNERSDWAGGVVVPLDEAEARAAITELLEDGVEAIAISFLWSITNPEHERRVESLVREMAPDVFVSCAHRLSTKPGEYERTAGAVINGFIGPQTSSYVNALAEKTAASGYDGSLLIMQASGGVMPLSKAVSAPVLTIGAGPVGGLAGTEMLAAQLGHENVIATDMGGTSFEVGLIQEGAGILATETIVNQYTFFMPRLLIESIGAGGGSIIWFDEQSETLRVGPRSAQARPGPACYGRGGKEATVTDANLVLGYLADGARLSDDVRLDREAALRALTRVGEPLGLDPVQAAAGARVIVDRRMADLIRQLTVERGLDPRDFHLYAYGGAGAQHASAFARELGVRSVVIPLGELGACWSALGVTGADLVDVQEHTELLTQPFDGARLQEIFQALEGRARESTRDAGFDPATAEVRRTIGMKFALQIHQVEVDAPEAFDEAALERLSADFGDLYEVRYGEGSGFAGAGTEIDWMRVHSRVPLGSPTLGRRDAPLVPGDVGSRDAYWPELGTFVATAIYQGRALATGAEVPGPAIVEYPSTIVVLPPGDVARIDDFGNLVIELGSEHRA